MNELVIILILLIWVIFTFIIVSSIRRDGYAPFEDIGIMFLLALILYTTLPPISWIFQGWEYNNPEYPRLFKAQPSSEDVFIILKITLFYILGYATIFYRKYKYINKPIKKKETTLISDEIMYGTILLLIITIVITLVINFGGIIAQSTSYIDQYLVIQQLPLAIKILIKFTSGLGNVLKFILLIAILQRWPRHKGLLSLYLLITIFSFDPEGSRTGLVTNILTMIIVWHFLIYQIKTKYWIILFSFGILTFLFLGEFRDTANLNETIQNIKTNGIPLGELDSIWANSLELITETQDFNVPISVLTSEFFAFIPSQLLPFDKLALHEWFLETYHWQYKALGGGFAFGAISQVIVGGRGIFEAFLRGAIICYLAIYLLNKLRSKKIIGGFILCIFIYTPTHTNVSDNQHSIYSLILYK